MPWRIWPGRENLTVRVGERSFIMRLTLELVGQSRYTPEVEMDYSDGPPRFWNVAPPWLRG